MPAKLINIEGTDGSGKETQSIKLNNYLIENGYKVKLLHFPMYDNDSSFFVKKFLNGDFGNNGNLIVDKYGISLFYALDRYITFCSNPTMLEDYDYIILDRYVGSNMIYQASRIYDNSEFNNFIQWVSKLEYNDLHLPRPDIIIFLDMPPIASNLLRKNRLNKITNNSTQDINESDSKFLEKVYNTAKYISQIESWEHVSCVWNNYINSIYDIYSKDEIFNKIISILKNNNIIPG